MPKTGDQKLIDNSIGAINYVLNKEHGLLDTLLKDLLKNSGSIKNRGSYIKILGLAFRRPGVAFNLIKLARSSYMSDETFQQKLLPSLLQNSNLLNFIRKFDYIPEIVQLITTSMKEATEKNPHEITEYLNLKNLIQDIKDEDLGTKIKEILQNTNLLDALAGKTKDLLILMDLYNKGYNNADAWNAFKLKFLVLILQLIQENPIVAKYIEQHNIFSIMIQNIINQVPEIQGLIKNTNGSIGNFVAEILKNPQSIQSILNLIESYEQGRIVDGVIHTAGLVATHFNAIGGAIGNYVTNTLIGDQNKQLLVNEVLKGLSLIDKSQRNKSRIKLAELITQTADSLKDTTRLLEKPEPITNPLSFDHVYIVGEQSDPLNFESLDIKDISFINSKLENVSFANSTFTNVSFVSATFSNVDFSGATIDAATLRSMINSIKTSKIPLDGITISGDLSGIDLSGISLKNADLSRVTNVNNVNLEGTDLTGAHFSDTLKEQLKETYNLEQAIFTPNILPQNIISEQKSRVIEKTVDCIDNKATSLKEPMTKEQKKALAIKIKDLTQDSSTSIVKSYIKKVLEKTQAVITAALSENRFPATSDNPTISHVADYLDTTGSVMTLLYKNKTSPEAIELMVIATKIADNITKKLFGEGKNRGKDGLIIREMLQEIIGELLKENFALNADTLSSIENMVGDKNNGFTKIFYDNSNYTLAGLLFTGGIWLNEEKLKKNDVKNLIKTKIISHLNLTKNLQQHAS